jgi:hypothetical protein
MTHDVFTPEFAGWRFYGDGSETGASALELEDTNTTVNLDSGNVQVQIRCMVQEIGAGSASGATTDDYAIEYLLNNGGGWQPITASSSAVQADTGSTLSDGSATTNRSTDGVTDGNGSFVAGEQEAGNGTVEDHQLTADNFTEHVYALLIIADDLVDADFVDFRIALNGGNPGMDDAVIPRITMDKVAASDELTAQGVVIMQ